MNSLRPSRTHDFSRRGYASILHRALALGYKLCSFDSFAPPGTHPVLLLRHDLDHSLRAAIPIAELEEEMAVRSTYFVQVTCDFYNLLGREGRSIVARIAASGHEVGLHYDSRRYAHIVNASGLRAALKALRLDIELLEDIAGHPVVSASRHLPSDTESFDVLQVLRNEAYEARFTLGNMTYISDSLLAWRQATPHALLDEFVSFQLLTHPLKWAAPVTSLKAFLRRALREEYQALRERYEEIEPYYEDLLRRRKPLDERFQRRRGHPSGTTARKTSA